MGKSQTAKTHCPYGHPYDEENTTYRRNGKERRCRACNNNYSSRKKEEDPVGFSLKNREKLYRSRHKNLEGYRMQEKERQLRKRYGMTLEDYEDMVDKQKGVCIICGCSNPKDRPLHVDHDHSTGRVRGLLCQQCNHGLGNFRDNTTFLQNAIDYLEGE